MSILCMWVQSVDVVSADIYRLTRRHAFLEIWDGIHRPYESVWGGFSDVQMGDVGYDIISYALQRGIIDEASSFRPDLHVTAETAMLWILRTRNVADLDDMTRENIPYFVEKYGLHYPDEDADVQSEDIYQWTRDLDAALAEEVHKVSYYADDFHGAGTAFGETFDMYAITAAHRTFPHNTLVKVTNVENDKSVIVRINDRGPYVHGRSLDLSLASFEKIAERSRGVIRARLERLGDVSLIDPPMDPPVETPRGDVSPSCLEGEPRYQKRITKDVRFHRGVPHDTIIGETLTLGANQHFVVRGITYPDGTFTRIQDFVLKDETYQFTPHEEGEYLLWFGTIEGRLREMRLRAGRCM